MSNPHEPTDINHAGSPVTTPTLPADVENPTPGFGFGVSAITRRWKREDLLKRGSLIARGLAFLFSLLSFIIMASNKHGDWKNFDRYEEYRYLLAIAILSTLYTGGQALRHVNALWKGKQIFEQRISAMVDFFGDQVVAYLLISSVSSAIPLTNRMREGQDNIFTDSSASAISMSFFGFLSLAISAMVSGYKLSTQSCRVTLPTSQANGISYHPAYSLKCAWCYTTISDIVFFGPMGSQGFITSQGAPPMACGLVGSKRIIPGIVV